MQVDGHTTRQLEKEGFRTRRVKDYKRVDIRSPSGAHMIDHSVQCAVSVIAMSDVTKAVLFLLSDQAAVITGTTLMVDGGYSQR